MQLRFLFMFQQNKHHSHRSTCCILSPVMSYMKLTSPWQEFEETVKYFIVLSDRRKEQNWMRINLKISSRRRNNLFCEIYILFIFQFCWFVIGLVTSEKWRNEKSVPKSGKKCSEIWSEKQCFYCHRSPALLGSESLNFFIKLKSASVREMYSSCFFLKKIRVFKRKRREKYFHTLHSFMMRKQTSLEKCVKLYNPYTSFFFRIKI